MDATTTNVDAASRDEVDFAVTAASVATATAAAAATTNANRHKEAGDLANNNINHNNNNNHSHSMKSAAAAAGEQTNNTLKYHNNNNSNNNPKKSTTKERLSLFSFGKKISQKAAVQQQQQQASQSESSQHQRSNAGTPAKCSTFVLMTASTPQLGVPIGTPPRQHKFVKSASITRLLGGGGGGGSGGGNTPNGGAAKREEDKNRKYNSNKGSKSKLDGKFNTYGGRRRLSGPYLDRFKRSKEDGDAVTTNSNTGGGNAAATTDDSGEAPTSAAEELWASRRGGGGSGETLACDGEQVLEHYRAEGVIVPQASGPRVRVTGDGGLNAGTGSGVEAAMRTLSRGLGKLWWRRTHSVEISTPDPEFKVCYLGNVLTGWAKGEASVEKQLNTLWRNYTQNSKPDVVMRLKVCASGLKATTRQHGLTEYWANRITHCCAPKHFPRVFCWIYRHEGRKLKHELRCHAVLCAKEKIAQDICAKLKENLESALREFKREKILRQNARLSLANAAYENPSLPRRKILLSVGGNNYRPPLERSKSAPKLMAIEEAIGEEDGDDGEVEATNEPEMRPCCQRDSLYPAMTLGRRRCRRGHSIRRTGNMRPALCGGLASSSGGCCGGGGEVGAAGITLDASHSHAKTTAAKMPKPASVEDKEASDDSNDDFEKLLQHNNYDASASLANELLPYFELQLHKNASSSLGDLTELDDHHHHHHHHHQHHLHHTQPHSHHHNDEEEGEPLSLLPTINSDPMAHPNADFNPNAIRSATPTDGAQAGEPEEDEEEDGATPRVRLRRSGVCSDGEEDVLDLDGVDGADEDDFYFRQAAILNLLHRHSMRKMAQLSLSSDENSSLESNRPAAMHHHHHHHHHHQAQSSISSTTSSTLTSISATMAAATATEESSSLVSKAFAASPALADGKRRLSPDSDEGSISSGCETASTATTNQDDLSLQYRPRQSVVGGVIAVEEEEAMMTTATTVAAHNEEESLSAEEIYQRLEARLQERRHDSDATTFSSSSSITLKVSGGSGVGLGGGGGGSPTSSLTGMEIGGGGDATTSPHTDNNMRQRRLRRQQRSTTANNNNNEDASYSDSECSDESGYVEYQEHQQQPQSALLPTKGGVAASMLPPTKPQLPPKPLPRRTLAQTPVGGGAATAGTAV